MRRTKEEAEKTKEDILQAGLKVFSEKGFSAATIKDITKETNYTRGAIYWHFESKDAILIEIYKRESSHLIDIVMETFNNKDSFIENLRNISETLLFRNIENNKCIMMNKIQRNSSETQLFRELDISFSSEAYTFFIPMIQEAIDNGSIRKFSSPSVVFNILTSFFDGVTDHIISDQKIPKIEIKEMIESLIRGISNDKV